MNIQKDPLKDQFFLTDLNLVSDIAKLAEITEKDTILEIGAGTGILTRELAKNAKQVIAFEIDNQFKSYLSKLPKNVDVHFESAWKFIQLRGKFKKKKSYNKIVANPPYSFIEPMLHNLTFLDYDKVILVVPIKIVNKIKEGIFGSFFIPEIKIFIDKEKFDPIPRTNSAVIDLIKLDDPIKTKDLALFLRQYVYQHEDQKIKNSLMEGLIKYQRLVTKKTMTKNKAREIIKTKEINSEILEESPKTNEIYTIISEKFIEKDL